MNFSDFLKEQEVEKQMSQLKITPQENNTNSIKRRMPKSHPQGYNTGLGNNRQLQTQQHQEIIQNRNMGVPVVERVETVLDSRCVAIDSRDRNRDQFPNSNRFQVQVNPSNTFVGAALYTNFKNIQSIRLVQAILPDFTGNHAYIVLVIPELQDTLVGTNDILKKSFAMLFPDQVNGDFVNCRVNDMCYCAKTFVPALANIRTLTLEFYAPDGTLVDFGTDSSLPTAPISTVQNMIVIEITTVNSNRKVLEAMPIFT